MGNSYESIGDALAQMGDKSGALESYRRALSVREAMAAADPNDTVTRGDLANAYANLGEVYAMLAAEAQTPLGKSRDYWREARSWYQRSLNLYHEMRAQGALRKSDAGEPDKIIGKIAQCEAALAKTRKRTHH